MGDGCADPWMRMPGQTWLDAAAAFEAMWVVMMIAMMLPVLVPMLWHYRKALTTTGEARPGWPTSLAGMGYFFVWAMFGIAAFPAGAVLERLEMDMPALTRAVPLAVGVVVLIAGALQFTAWKSHYLACCRKEDTPACGRGSGSDAGSAWRHGVRLGLQCSACCGNLMAVPLVVGVMDLRAMAVVTVAIAVERLAPQGMRLARAIGAALIAAGLFLIAQAAVT